MTGYKTLVVRCTGTPLSIGACVGLYVREGRAAEEVELVIRGVGIRGGLGDYGDGG